MKSPVKLYKRHRFLSEIISYAVWLCHRFNLSRRHSANGYISPEAFEAKEVA